MSEKIEKARDITAPYKRVTLDGQTYGLVFNNKAARVAEAVYEDEYGRDTGYYDILQEMAMRKHRAMMAVLYGALVAGGAEMTWEDFDAKFTLASIDGFAEILRAGVIESLPDDDGKN